MAAGRRRLECLCGHVVARPTAQAAPIAPLALESHRDGADAQMDAEQMDAELRRLFGPHCKAEGPLMAAAAACGSTVST